MTAPINPAAVSLYGKDNWYFVPSGGIASASYIPTAAELTAGSVLDVTDMLFRDTARPAQTTNRTTRERRYGSTVVPEALGAATLTGGELHFQFSPQAASGSDGKKAYEKFGSGAGTTGFLVNRQGVAKATTPTAGQFVNVFPVDIGASFPSPAGDNESEEAGMVAPFAVTTSAPAINVELT